MCAIKKHEMFENTDSALIELPRNELKFRVCLSVKQLALMNTGNAQSSKHDREEYFLIPKTELPRLQLLAQAQLTKGIAKCDLSKTISATLGPCRTWPTNKTGQYCDDDFISDRAGILTLRTVELLPKVGVGRRRLWAVHARQGRSQLYCSLNLYTRNYWDPVLGSGSCESANDGANPASERRQKPRAG